MAKMGQRCAGRGDQGVGVDSGLGVASLRRAMCKTLSLIAIFVLPLSGCRSGSVRNSGAFVEARTASVFAGACHYGSEYTTAGREAVLAWRFDAGPARGARVVALVTSDENLAVLAGSRRSVVYLEGPEGACDKALTALLERGFLGEVVAVQGGARITLEGEDYEVLAGSGVRLSGVLLPDRACCSMPSHVWYDPLAADGVGIVGNSLVFQCDVPELDVRFRSAGENDAFVGSFIW